MKTQFTVNKENLESTMERIFDAPREKVFAAHADKALVEQWWGPRRYKVNVEKYDARVGGEWRIIHEKDGERHVFFGEFTEWVPNEKITWTFHYEPYADTETIETITFTESEDGKTKLHMVSKYPTIEALEGMLQSGMEDGANETWDRLEETVGSI